MKPFDNALWCVRRQVRHHGGRILVVTLGITVALAIAAGVAAARDATPTESVPTPTAPTTPTTPETPAPAPPEGEPIPHSAALSWNEDGTPVRFGCNDPTITIEYAPDGEPYPALGDLEAVADELETALSRPVDVGERPPAGAADDGTIAVRWVPTAADLPDHPDPTVLGVGGPTTRETSAGHSEIVSGTVTLNASMELQAGDGPDGARQLLRHELMHSLGADHRPEGSDSVMTPTLGSGRPDGSLSPADRTLLAALGGSCTHKPARVHAGPSRPSPTPTIHIQIPTRRNHP